MFLGQGFLGGRGGGGSGTPGRDGLTPTIGKNGNWFIGTNDTGIKAGGLPAGGRIVSTDDPKTKPPGRYYVQEKFTGAPTLPGSNYVGLMDIIHNYDGNNGDVIRYYSAYGMYYLTKYTGGWANAWVGEMDNLDGKAITHVALSGNQLTFTHADGAKHAITLPQSGSPGSPTGLQAEITKAENDLKAQGADLAQIKSQIGEINHNIQNLTGIYSFRGLNAPTNYPTEPKNAYFINLHNSPGPVALPMPNLAHPLNDGTVFFVNNENTQQRITVTPPTGDGIDNAKTLAIEPMQFVMLVRHGNNWIKSASGYIPSSLDDVEHRVAASLAGELHTNQQITDMINNWFANPATQGKLDQILQHLGYSKTGAGPVPHPSSVRVYYGAAAGYPTDFSGETAEVATHQAMIINHLDQNPQKVWIAVPKSLGSKVSGISANNGLAAEWQSKDITVSGEQWTVFLSPTSLADDHISFSIKWSV